MYFVYLIESIPAGKYYIGQTSNFKDRLTKHNAGYEKSTKAYSPWKLIGFIETNTRKEAVKLEKKIKGLRKGTYN